MARTIKNAYPNANIVAIDYDPGATRVNQENRIKLMLAVARERLEDRTQPPAAREETAPRREAAERRPLAAART